MEVLHNPRCGKSKQCLAFLEENKKDFTVINYLQNPLTAIEIEDLLTKLKCTPIEIVRQKEKIWIEQFKGKKLSSAEIIQAMVTYPILIERPIVIDGNKAYIARDEQMLNKVI